MESNNESKKSSEQLRIIRGTVNADGTVKCGKGFGSSLMQTGTYEVYFFQDFPTRPTVVVSQNYPGNDDFNSNGGNTRDNAVVVAVLNNKFKIATGNHLGDRDNRAFEFIAVGLA